MTVPQSVLNAVLAHPTAIPGNNWTDTSGFNCVGVNLLPFKGTEVLCVTLCYLALVAMYAVTFTDVAIKQAWPHKFLDAVVWRRVQKLQSDFPSLLPKAPTQVGSSEEEVECDSSCCCSTSDNTIKVQKSGGEVVSITYDKIVSQEPYVATCSVDEDLTFQLANNEAFGTVSEYCSSTVRGYAMLSAFLPMVATCLGFLWCHNAMIDPIGDNYARYVTLLGYCLAFLTGVIMCGPADHTVHRTRNIIVWDSIPTTSQLLAWHTNAIIGFCLIPMLSNVYQLLTLPKETHLNANATWIGIACQLFGLGVFMLPMFLKKSGKIDKVQGDCIQIIGEIICVMSSVLTFVQVETFSTAACAQMPTTYSYAVGGTMFTVLGTLFAKHYAGGPVGPYTNNPSVLLMHAGSPVAVSGPPPLLNYNREAAILPIVLPSK